MIPIAGTFDAHEGWPRRSLTLYTGALALVGGGGLALSVFQMEDRALLLLGLFFIGVLLFGWVANALLMSTPKR